MLTVCTCHYNCYSCTSNSTYCTWCSVANHRVLNGSSCVPMLGYFDNGTANAILCGDANWLNCINVGVCVQ